MIVYVFDKRWGSPRKPAPRHAAKRVVTVDITPEMSVPQIVRSIKTGVGEKSKQGACIDLMLLCSHGNVGLMDIGTGLRAANAHFFGKIRGLMKPAQPTIAGGTGLELHGCWVASAGVPRKDGILGTRSHNATRRPPEFGRFYPGKPRPGVVSRGWELLWELALALKVPVKAGVDAQIGDKNFRFEGPTITVGPGGTIMDDATWRKAQRKRAGPIR